MDGRWDTTQANMMTSSNGNIFRVTGPLCGEVTGPGEIPAQRPLTRSFDVFFFICAWINDWVNNREAGDLRRHRGHYDVNVMKWTQDTKTNTVVVLWLIACQYLLKSDIFMPFNLGGLAQVTGWVPIRWILPLSNISWKNVDSFPPCIHNKLVSQRQGFPHK